MCTAVPLNTSVRCVARSVSCLLCIPSTYCTRWELQNNRAAAGRFTHQANITL